MGRKNAPEAKGEIFMDKRGIDVSSWQGVIDWDAVKSSGVEFAILRSSFGSPSPSQVDNQFYNNVKGAQAAGIPIGAYHYGYAVTEEEARNEAGFFLDTVKGIRFEYPLYYDVEDSATMGSLDRDALTKVIRAFCETVEKAGYYVGIYASLNWLTNKFYPDQLPYDVWVAQYYSEDQYDGHHGMWQYTSGGTVGGIAGKVDMNIAYRDFPKLIKDKGLNGWGSGESGGSGGSEEGSGGERDDRLGIGHCVADVLNVRSGPGTDYPVVYQISTGNMVDVLKISENGWLQINCLHGVGWCAAQYIQWSPFESQQPPDWDRPLHSGCIERPHRKRPGLSGSVSAVPGEYGRCAHSQRPVASDQLPSGLRLCASQYIDWFRTNLQVPAIGVGKCTADVLNIRSGPATDLPYCSLFPKAIWWMCWRITAEAGFGFDAFWVQAGAPLSILTGAGTTIKKAKALKKAPRKSAALFPKTILA